MGQVGERARVRSLAIALAFPIVVADAGVRRRRGASLGARPPARLGGGYPLFFFVIAVMPLTVALGVGIVVGVVARR